MIKPAYAVDTSRCLIDTIRCVCCIKVGTHYLSVTGPSNLDPSHIQLDRIDEVQDRSNISNHNL